MTTDSIVTKTDLRDGVQLKCGTAIETPDALPNPVLIGPRLCDDCGLVFDHVNDINLGTEAPAT